MTNPSENPPAADNQQGRINQTVGFDPYQLEHLAILQMGAPEMSGAAYERIADHRHETQQLLEYMNGH